MAAKAKTERRGPRAEFEVAEMLWARLENTESRRSLRKFAETAEGNKELELKIKSGD